MSDYYLYEDEIFKDICIIISEESGDICRIKIAHSFYGGDWANQYAVNRKKCRPLEDWEFVKYKLLGLIPNEQS